MKVVSFGIWVQGLGCLPQRTCFSHARACIFRGCPVHAASDYAHVC